MTPEVIRQVYRGSNIYISSFALASIIVVNPKGLINGFTNTGWDFDKLHNSMTRMSSGIIS